MEYRRFGKTNWPASILGFGAMRLPVVNREPGNIDEPQVKRMVTYAVEHGVNYIDTAFGYHEGRSETCLGRLLKDGLREKIKLATKLPPWEIASRKDFDRIFNEQLRRLQTDRIDFYLLHSLNRTFWPKLKKMGVLKWAERAVSDGRIGRLGFSFHDDLPTFKTIVDDYDGWTLCQIQFNYMDVDYQAGIAGLEYAAEKGLAVVVMEPLRGGKLGKMPPAQIAKLFPGATNPRSAAEWGLDWVWSHPQVSVVLSGVSECRHIVENVAFAENSKNRALSREDLLLIDRVREAYRGLAPIPCTGCRYCLPCDQGVSIPRIFELYNEAFMYDDARHSRLAYRAAWGLKKEQRGDRCTACARCQDLCPQQIDIPSFLKKAHGFLSSDT